MVANFIGGYPSSRRTLSPRRTLRTPSPLNKKRSREAPFFVGEGGRLEADLGGDVALAADVEAVGGSSYATSLHIEVFNLAGCFNLAD